MMNVVSSQGIQKKFANDLYQKVIKLINAGDHRLVIDEINKVDKNLIFSHGGLLNALGISLRNVGNYEAAIQMYRAALNLDDSHGGTWSNLGNALKDANYPNASLAAHQHALELSNKQDSRLWHNYGIALAIAGQHEDAIAALENAITISPENIALRWDLARSQLAIGDYKNGYENYKFRWNIEDAPPKRVFGSEWNGEPLGDKKLFVYVEQGFGDFIQCARYLPWLKLIAPNMLVEVKSELKGLMQHSYPDIEFVDFLDQKIEYKEGSILSLLDAPRFFSDRGIPHASGYLTPPKANKSEFQALIEKKLNTQSLKVGIIWSGSVTFKRNKYRSAPVEWFASNLFFPGVELYSLQMGPRSEDLKGLKMSVVSAELVPLIRDFSDTAVILKNLDLVIMTCSSTAHLCGSLGIPCWVLLDSAPHWLWGQDNLVTPWYSSLRLFRQTTPGDWKSVFDNVSSELLRLSSKRKK